ncbi:MAG: response regulator [bacterium]
MIKILLVEDNPADALLIRRICGGEADCALDITHVESLAEAKQAIEREHVDAVMLDLTLPDSAAADTLAWAERLALTVPTIVLTGLNDQDLADKTVFRGVQDYLIKGQIDYHVLNRSIRYALNRLRAAQEKNQLLAELRDALSRIKQLHGLMPICSACKRIRDDQGYWAEVEQYIQAHSGAIFTHSICPDCSRRLYPNLVLGQTEGATVCGVVPA